MIGTKPPKFYAAPACAISSFSMAHQWRKQSAPLTTVRLKENLMAQMARHYGLSNGAPMAHGALAANKEGTG
jgi:hypothetical protein